MRTKFSKTYITADGIVLVCINGICIRRSRYVMSKILGRKLLSTEIAHHKNEIPNDDRPDNLEVKMWGEHTRHHHKGKKIPEWQKERLREVHTGNKYCLGRVLSEETKHKISMSVKGFKHTSETRKQMSQTHRGMKHSEETKKKMSITHKKLCEARKT